MHKSRQWPVSLMIVTKKAVVCLRTVRMRSRAVRVIAPTLPSLGSAALGVCRHVREMPLHPEIFLHSEMLLPF